MIGSHSRRNMVKVVTLETVNLCEMEILSDLNIVKLGRTFTRTALVLTNQDKMGTNTKSLATKNTNKVMAMTTGAWSAEEISTNVKTFE